MPVILTRVIDDTSKLASKLTHENDHVSRSKSTVIKLNNSRNSRFSSVLPGLHTSWGWGGGTGVLAMGKLYPCIHYNISTNFHGIYGLWLIRLTSMWCLVN